jgi:hypothetical protein
VPCRTNLLSTLRMAPLGHKPSSYRRFSERLLCEVKQPFGWLPGERLRTAITGPFRATKNPALGRFVMLVTPPRPLRGDGRVLACAVMRRYFRVKGEDSRARTMRGRAGSARSQPRSALISPVSAWSNGFDADTVAPYTNYPRIARIQTAKINAICSDFGKNRRQFTADLLSNRQGSFRICSLQR